MLCICYVGCTKIVYFKTNNSDLYYHYLVFDQILNPDRWPNFCSQTKLVFTYLIMWAAI